MGFKISTCLLRLSDIDVSADKHEERFAENQLLTEKG